jgi:hypothetical protein
VKREVYFAGAKNIKLKVQSYRVKFKASSPLSLKLPISLKPRRTSQRILLLTDWGIWGWHCLKID